MRKLILTLALALATCVAWAQKGTFEAGKGTFEAGKGTFLLNGKPFIVKAAEVHYPRIPRPYWEHRIQMCKALGMNAVCIYIFWNIHEQQEGQFDFTGNSDVAEFCRLAQKTLATATSPNSAVWHRKTASMSLCVQVHTFVPSGRWAVCLGGC